VNEQPNTTDDLSNKIFSIDVEKQNDIIFRFDGSEMNDENYWFVTQISQVISDDTELQPGNFELGIFKVEIKSLKTYEKVLILVK